MSDDIFRYPVWLEQVVKSYKDDTYVHNIIAKLDFDLAAVPHFFWKDGLVRYKNRIWIGNVPALQTKILASMHSAAVGGHSGVPVTYRKFKQLFVWQ